MKVKTFKIVSGTRKLSLSLVVFMAKIRTIPQSPVNLARKSLNSLAGASMKFISTTIRGTKKNYEFT